MTLIRSASAKTTSMSCSTRTIVCRPRSARSRCTMRCDSSAPMPATGSSRSSSRGRVASAIAISSCRCSPWASVPATTSARAPSPTRSSVARAGSRRARSALAGVQKRKLWPAWACTARATLSSAVNSGKMLVIWNERARPRRERVGPGNPVTSSPANRIVPASGARSPESWPISVVLPAPLGPMIASVSPSATSRSTPSVATRPPKRLVRPRTASSGSAIARDRAGQQAPEAAARVEHDEDEQRTQDDLPVHRPRGEDVLEQEEHDGGELVAERREADGAHARLVGLRGADHDAEARVNETVAQRQEGDEHAEDDVVEDVAVREVHHAAELAAPRQPHAVVGAPRIDGDAEVIEHLRERERDHDERHAARPQRHGADAQDEIEADRRDGEDHDPPEQIEIEGLVGQRGDHGHEAEPQQAGHQRERARPGAHQPRTAGNNPWGRKRRTAAIRMEISIEESAGPAL